MTSEAAGLPSMLSIREPSVCQAVSRREGAVELAQARSKASVCTAAFVKLVGGGEDSFALRSRTAIGGQDDLHNFSFPS